MAIGRTHEARGIWLLPCAIDAIPKERQGSAPGYRNGVSPPGAELQARPHIKDWAAGGFRSPAAETFYETVVGSNKRILERRWREARRFTVRYEGAAPEVR